MALRNLIMLAALIGAASATASLSWTSCGDSSDWIRLTGLSVRPSTAEAGDTVTLSGTATVTHEIYDGSVSTEAKADGSSIYNQTISGCEFLHDRYNLTCPIPTGTFSTSQEFILPNIAFKDSFVLSAKGKDDEEHPLFCTQLIAVVI